MKSPNLKLTFFLAICLVLVTNTFAQCPTVANDSQVFCNLESLLVSDLNATDNGGGIAWFDTASSTTPLSPSSSLIDGENYFADNSTGDCGSRIEVVVTILGAPTGLNFQGVCVENANEATILDLEVIGNDVQWYLTPSGGTPLDVNSILIDETIYYADQSNPETGCRTSRLAIFVNVGIVPIPTGDAVQQFCANGSDVPTVGDLIASGNNNWYLSLSSASPLDLNTPLIDGNSYFATTVDPPCESESRWEVVVEIVFQESAGTNGTLDICEDDTNTFDLFDSLNGSPELGGTWSPALASGSGIFDPALDAPGIYTYTVTSSNPECEDATADVTVTIIPPPDAGTDGLLSICENDTNTYDLFDSLNGSPELGGTWSPALASGSGIFDPAIDAPGTYTYTVVSPNPVCGNVSANVTVNLATPPDAGSNGTVDICEDDTNTFDLFDSLNGSPELGGTWSPALASGSGIFDPALDTPGIYTYTVTSSNPECEDATADVTVTIIPPPDAGTDGLLSICENDTNTYDLFDSLNGSPELGGTWSPALASGSGIFDPAIDAPGIYTYTVVSPNPVCGNVSANVTVNLATPPDAGSNGTVDICEDDTNTFDLFDSLNGSPELGGTWSPALASGSGIFDPALDTPGIYTYTVTSSNPECEDATADVTVTIIPPPDAGTDGLLSICENDTNTYDLFDSLNGSPEPGGTWSPALASGSGIFDPAIDAPGIYTYTVTSPNPVCGNVSANVTVNLATPPDAGSNGTVDICEDDTNTFDLFDSLNGSPELGGTWSPALASGSGIFDPALDTPGIYTYTVTSSNPECEDATADVTVTIIPPPDAGTDGLLSICENDTNTYDLFDSLNGSPELGGTWSPALASGSGIFDPAIDAPGIYTYTVTSPNPVCGNVSANVTVNLATPPDAGSNGTVDICEDDTNTFDLFDSLNGSPELGGTWSPALASGSGIFDPALDTPGIYTYTVTSSNPECEDATADVTVTIIPPPDAGTDGLLSICENDTNTYDLFDSLNGSPELGGTWSPALASGSGIFDPAIDAPGIYTYTVVSPNPVCGNVSANVTVNLATPPDAGSNGTVDICEDDTNTFDLFDSLNGSPELGGTWSPALASGSGIFDPALDAPGIYTYTVTSSNPECEDATADVTVTIIPPPDAGTDGLLSICENDTNTYDLFDSLNGSPELGGTWSPALASGSGIFDPAIDAPGIYTYTVTSPNPVCGNVSANVTVNLATPPDAGSNGTVDICEDDTNTFDLFDSLNGSPELGGTWSPALASGSGIFDPALDTPGIYTYTVTSSNPECEDATADVTVTIIPPPDAGTDGLLSICENDTNTYDLFDSLNGSPELGGTWSPALASGSGIFDPAIDAPGIYTYTVTSPNPVCGNVSANVTVNLATPPDAGSNGTVDICEDDTNTFDLFDSLNGSPELGGTWSPALASGSGIFDPALDTPGIYTYTVTSSNPECEDATADVTVTIIPPPDAGTDGLLSICENDTNTYDLFDSLNGSPELGGTWSPALASGSGIFDPAIDAPGIYTYTVVSPNPVCGNVSANVTVNLATPPDAGSNGTVDICEDDTNTFDLFDSLNGSPELGGTWSPALASGSGIFDPALDTPGIYTYTVTSSNPECEDATADVTVTIIPPPDAGTDGLLSICENDTNTYDLFDSLNGSPEPGGTWSPALASGSGIFDPAIDAPGIYTYTVERSECLQTDSSEVIVTINDLPDASGLIISISDTCEGLDLLVDISNVFNLTDGDYTFTYDITGANIISETILLSIVDGEASFVIDADIFEMNGSHQFTITNLTSVLTNCSADISTLIAEDFAILESISPEITENGNTFCVDDNATIANLSNNIVNSDNNPLQWYDDEFDGTVYNSDTLLEDGITYYATVISEDGCESLIRLAVTVSLIDCFDDIVIPDGFSPDGDGINETFDVKNLDVLYPNFKMTIYNRNGNILYEGNKNTPKWNGVSNSGRTFGNNELPVGVYFFIIEFNDGIRKELQGRVYLNR